MLPSFVAVAVDDVVVGVADVAVVCVENVAVAGADVEVGNGAVVPVVVAGVADVYAGIVVNDEVKAVAVDGAAA